MSDIKKQINKLVASKMQSRNARLQEMRDDNDETANIMTDYRLYFDGARDALEAAGISDSDKQAISLAYDTNETEMKLLEQKMNLDELLNTED